MEHLRAAHVLHAPAGPYHHLLPVAGLVLLLAVDVRHLRFVIGHHLVVVLVVARGDDHAFGRVELDVAVLALGDHARHRAAGLPEAKVFVTAERVKHGKPAPDAYLLGAELLGLAPGDCAVVEDAPAGLLSGLNAGCRTIAVNVPADAPMSRMPLPVL